MSQLNDRKALEAIEAACVGGGDIAVFVDDSARRKQHPAPSHTAMKRLAREKYIEVETHSVSPWIFGEGHLPYSIVNARARNLSLSAKDQQAVDEYHRIRSLPGEPTFKSRKEIHVRMLPRGREYLETLRALS